MKKKDAHFETLAIHTDEKQDLHKALTPPIYLSSTFTFDNIQEADEAFAGEREAHIYSRHTNPTIDLFEKQMTKIEHGAGALAFSSGMAAISSVFMSLLKQGDEILAHRNLYGCTYVLTTQILPKFGIRTKFIDMSQPENILDAMTDKTKIIFFETPTNPCLDMVDIAEIVKIAKTRNVKTIVDNTFATPYFQQPLGLGVDIVLHSATKYLSGHGDLVAGVVISNDKDYLAELNLLYRHKLGGIISPFDAWLLLRGLKTLGIRMEKHQENAKAVAEFLANHPKIEKALYPGLPEHPSHHIAQKQMSGFGGIVSFDLKGDAEKAKKLVDNVKLISLAVSLGDTETLIQIPALMTHREFPPEEYYKFGLSDKTIRLSVGLEDKEDIIGDLDQALQTI